MARGFLTKHGALVAAGGKPHRVSVYLAGQIGDALRADMEAHTDGRAMPTRLSAEVCAYQLCLLGDTCVESVHRDVSPISARSPASVVAPRAATLRLDQSLTLLERQRWRSCSAHAPLPHLDSHLARNPARSRRGVKPTVKHRRVFEVVYRSGQEPLLERGRLEAILAPH